MKQKNTKTNDYFFSIYKANISKTPVFIAAKLVKAKYCPYCKEKISFIDFNKQTLFQKGGFDKEYKNVKCWNCNKDIFSIKKINKKYSHAILSLFLLYTLQSVFDFMFPKEDNTVIFVSLLLMIPFATTYYVYFYTPTIKNETEQKKN